ncbi:hypothetical protein Ancab_004265 [Ancistrocladus abbreviatus]
MGEFNLMLRDRFKPDIQGYYGRSNGVSSTQLRSAYLHMSLEVLDTILEIGPLLLKGELIVIQRWTLGFALNCDAIKKRGLRSVLLSMNGSQCYALVVSMWHILQRRVDSKGIVEEDLETKVTLVQNRGDEKAKLLRSNAREALWDRLKISYVQCLGVILGDFNVVLDYDDKMNGLSITIEKIRDFRECLEVVGIRDLKVPWQ